MKTLSSKNEHLLCTVSRDIADQAGQPEFERILFKILYKVFSDPYRSAEVKSDHRTIVEDIADALFYLHNEIESGRFECNKTDMRAYTTLICCAIGICYGFGMANHCRSMTLHNFQLN